MTPKPLNEVPVPQEPKGSSQQKTTAKVISIRGRHATANDPGVEPDSLVEPFAAIESPHGGRRYKIHDCTLVQHGHSLGETALYKTLWDAGETQADGTKLVTMGWRTMAHLAGMSDKSAKRNTRSLIGKLAIEQIGDEISETRTGRTYRIYSFAQILGKRKNEGMVRSKWDKGRRFVQEDGSTITLSLKAVIADQSADSTVVKVSTVDKTSTGTMDKTTPVPMDKMSPGTMDILSTPLRSLLRKQQGIKTSSSERQPIVQALAQYGTPDDQAVDQLWRACLVVCPDATADEVVRLIDEKGRQIARNRSVKNPIGFLLTAVPKCFRPESIAVLRQQRQRVLQLEAEQKEDEKRQEQEYIEMLKVNHEKYLAISLDPSAPQEKRKNAESMLVDILTALENAQRRAAESVDCRR
jgi:hypothetical protein